MSRLRAFLILANTFQSGVGSRDLLAAIRKGDYSLTQKLFRARSWDDVTRDACVRLLVEKVARANVVRLNGGGVLNDTVKRAMRDLSQFLLDHGASLQTTDREGFTLLMQAVLSVEARAHRNRMVEWLPSR